MPDSFTEAAAAANPPVAAQATPTPVPSIYNGLRVLAATADQVAGLGVKPITQQLTDLAHSVVSDVTDHKKQGDMLMGIAGTGEFGEGEGSELEGEAKKLYDGLRVRKADEVMVQPEVTSRATPTGEGASLPAEIHANLEKQAGRKLSDDEAVALDRANLERGMVSAPEGNTNQVREAKRSQLEKPRSDSEQPKKTTKQINADLDAKESKARLPYIVKSIEKTGSDTWSDGGKRDSWKITLDDGRTHRFYADAGKTSDEALAEGASIIGSNLHVGVPESRLFSTPGKPSLGDIIYKEVDAEKPLTDAEKSVIADGEKKNSYAGMYQIYKNLAESRGFKLDKQAFEKEYTHASVTKSEPGDLASSLGLKYKGELTKDSDVHQFEHPDHPGKTIAVKGKDLTTPEALKTRMAQKLADFEAGKKLGSR